MRKLKILKGDVWSEYGHCVGGVVVTETGGILEPHPYSGFGTRGTLWASIELEVYEPQVS